MTVTPWLDACPAWPQRELRHVGRFQGGGTPSKDKADYWDGPIPWVSPKDMKSWRIDRTEDYVTELGVRQSATRVAPAGSLVLVVRSGILQHTIPVAILGVDSALNQDMKAMIPGPEVDSRFIAYWINGFQQAFLLAWRKEGATVESLDFDLLRRTRIALPPLEHQHAIATFLDRKTAAIDALIARKERLIALLEEKRQALITQAVTKGLDPNVPMKDSGVEWLGRVPAHWTVQELRYRVSRIEQGWSPSCENRESDEFEWGVLKVGCVNYGRFSPGENKALPSNLSPVPSLEVRPGDVLVSRANTRELVGSAAYVESVRPRLLLCDKIFRLLYRGGTDPRFLVLLLQSRVCRIQLEREATGASSSMQNIGQDSVRRLVFAWAPPSEQQAIVESTLRLASGVDHVAEAISLQLDGLREYRQALITAAVTGKLDVAERLAQEAESHDRKG